MLETERTIFGIECLEFSSMLSLAKGQKLVASAKKKYTSNTIKKNSIIKRT